MLGVSSHDDNPKVNRLCLYLVVASVLVILVPMSIGTVLGISDGARTLSANLTKVRASVSGFTGSVAPQLEGSLHTTVATSYGLIPHPDTGISQISAKWQSPPASGLFPGHRSAGSVPADSSNPQAVWTADTISQLNGKSGLQYGSIYVDLVLPSYSPSYAMVYTLNGFTSTGDWYLAGIGYDLSSLAYYSSIGCGSGLELLLLVTDNTAATYAAACETAVAFAAGDTVTLGLNYTASSPSHMGMDACNGSNCEHFWITQPNPGATGLGVQSSARDATNGGFTGTMTWLMDASQNSCVAYSGLPKVDYNYQQGVYVSQYIPWSQSYNFYNSQSCYDSTTSIGSVTLPALSPFTIYTQVPASSSYGTHWVAGQNVSLQSALSASYWFRFQTDVSPLSSPTVSPSQTTADVGQTVSITGSAAGGIVPYQYDWYLNSTLQGRVSSPWTWTPSSPASYSIYANVVDTDYDYSGPSPTVSVSVTSDPTVAVPTASPPSGGIDQGQSVTFTSAVPSGGLAPYTFSWTSLPTGCTNSATSSDICTPTASGTFPVGVSITDANSYSASSPSISYTVDGPLTTTLAVDHTVIDLGQSFNLTVSAVGGASPYSYAYTNLPAGCSSSNVNPLICAPTSPGSFTTMAATVTDANGASSPTSSVSVTVNSDMTLIAFAASPAAVPQGGTTYFNATVTGGTTPYTYAYATLPPGCSSSSVASLLCVPSAAGSYTVALLVTDTAGRTVAGTTPLTVTSPVPPLAIASFSASPLTITLGASTTFTVSASGGYPAYTFAYSGLPSGCSSSNVTSLPCTPTATGSFTVTVTVTDTKSGSVTSSAPLTVNKAPVGGPTITSFTVTPRSVAMGALASFSVVASGGTSPLAYVYSGLPPGCATLDSSTLQCTPSSPGSFNVSVVVTDGAGKTATSWVILTVTSSGGGPIISSAIASPNPVPVSSTTKISVAVSGGTTPYSYSYLNLPPGCTSVNTNPLTCTPATVGNYTVTVVVTDNAGLTYSSSVPLMVTGKITPLAVTLAANLTSLQAGQSFTLTASAVGGVGPYTYRWTLNGTNLTSVAGTSPWSQRLTHPGSYSYTVWVTDAKGTKVQSGKVVVQITPAGTSGTGNTGAFPWWIVLLVLIVATALLAFFVVARRRKHEKEALAEATYGSEVGIEPGVSTSPSDIGASTTPEMTMDADFAGGALAGASSALQGEGTGTIPQGETTPEVTSDVALGIGQNSPEAPPLTNCPQCTGPLGPDQACPVCGVSWESDPKPAPLESPLELSPQAPASMGESSPPLTNCPQCGGTLGQDSVCPACEVSWVPEAQPSTLEAPQEIPPPPLSPAAEAPTPLSKCPMCSSPLGPDLSCQQCGVSWVKEQPIEPLLSPNYQVEVTMITPTPPEYEQPIGEAPAVTVPGRLGPDTKVAEAPSVVKEPTADAPAEPIPESEDDAARIQQELEQAQMKLKPSPPEAPPPPPVEEPAPAPVSGNKACFICGSPLEGDYCSLCDMHWDSQKH